MARQYKTSVRFCKVRSRDAEDLRPSAGPSAASRSSTARAAASPSTATRARPSRGSKREIGLSRGAIFNYFPSKEDLFLELAAPDSAADVRALGERRAARPSLREVVEDDPDWLGVYLELIRQARTDPELPGADRSRGSRGARARANRARVEQSTARGRAPRRPRGRERSPASSASSLTGSRSSCARAASRSADVETLVARALRRRTAIGRSSSGYAFAYTRLTRSTSSTYARVSGNAMPLPSASHWSTLPWPAWYAASASRVSLS